MPACWLRLVFIVFPLLVYIMKQPVMTEEVAAEGPFAVVMAPTRELAQQIEARPALCFPCAAACGWRVSAHASMLAAAGVYRVPLAGLHHEAAGHDRGGRR